MPVVTFGPYPNDASFIRHLSSGFGRPELPFFKRRDDGGSCRVQTVTKNDQHVSGFMTFDFGRLTPAIPSGVTITDAYLRLFAQGVSTAPVSDVDFSLLAKDGLWDPVTSELVPGASTGADSAVFDPSTNIPARCFVTVRAIGGAAQSAVAGSIDSGWAMRSGSYIIESTRAIGQVISHTTTFTLGSIDYRVRRVGSPAGSIFVTVHPVIGNVLNDSVVLATSGAIPCATLPVAFTNVNFLFTGGNQIGISSGQTRGYKLNVGYPISASNYVEASASSTGFSATPLQPMNVAGIARQLSEVNYPIDAKLPLLYEADNATIRVAPHGSVARMTSFPSFPTDNVFVDVRPPTLKDLIQEWIDDPGYVSNGIIGVQVTPSDTTEVPVLRQWDDYRLVVEYVVGVPAPPINFDLAVRPSGLVVPVAEVNCDADLPDADLEVEVPSANQTTSLEAADVPLELPSTNILLEAPTMAELLNLCPLDVDICVTRGDTRPFTFTLQLAGVPINITGSTFVLSIDTQPEPPDATTLVLALTGTLITPASGIVGFQFSTANWTGPPAIGPGDYFFDLQWTDSTGAITTAAKGGFEIKQDISK